MQTKLLFKIIILTFFINSLIGQTNQYPPFGDVVVRSYSPQLVLQRSEDQGGYTSGIQTKLLDGTNSWYFGNLHSYSWIVSTGDYQNPKLTILSSGNVGIGNDNPNAKLYVSGGDMVINNGGTGILRGDNYNYGSGGAFRVSSSNTISEQYIQLGRALSGTGAFFPHLTVMANNGNVGIGIANPTNKFSVDDDSGNQFVASYKGGKIYQNYKYTSLSYGESISAAAGNAANIGYMSHQTDKSLSGLYFTNYGESELLNSLFIKSGGNVGIGMTNPKNKLDVKGTIHSQEVKVDMLDWSDFVFKKEYNLPTLEQVEKHIVEKGHLENIPSEKEVLENGINLGEMNAKLLQKIEEMTLYIIDLKKENEKMKKENQTTLERQIDLERRINNIENK